MSQTVDFGASAEFGKHCFYVTIPASPNEAVSVFEDYGFDGDATQRETTQCRVHLARKLWNKIRDEARRDFNTRLKAKKLTTGTWSVGQVKLDRFLGRELCVLAWAAEHADLDECAIICQKWQALRPEERWWFYTKTASEAGLANQTDRGWRKAIYCALSDGESIKIQRKIKPVLKKAKDEPETSSLLDFVEKGEI
jgi:hypothetical protein